MVSPDVPGREVHPEAAEPVGGNDVGAHAQCIDARFAAGADVDGRPGGDDAQQLHGQRRVRPVADQRRRGNAAHDAVGFREQAEQADAVGNGLELREIADESGKPRQEVRHRPDRVHRADWRRGAGRLPRGPGHGLPQHHRGGGNRFGEHGIVAGQRPQAVDGRIVEPGHGPGDELRGSAVVLRENHVETDGGGAGIPQRRHEPGDQGTRPGPLPVGGQAALVDVGDRH